MPLLFTLMIAPAATVVIDPGHGGYQPGARAGGGKFEKELTLQVALVLKKELQARGHEVFLTRTEDKFVSLGARDRFANAHKADLLISLHANDSPTRTPSGIETYFLSSSATDAAAEATAARENDDEGDDTSVRELLDSILADLRRSNAQIESELLAARVQGTATKGTGAKSRGVKQAPLAVLKHVEMAGVLVEMGFLTNPDESKKLWSPSYQADLARGIAQGIDRFLADTDGGALPEIPPVSDAPEVSLVDRAKSSANAHLAKPKIAKAAKPAARNQKHVAAHSPAVVRKKAHAISRR